jgi:isopentenyl diphosphate isomerase/L-lactate dehydrogenase-like FMN-dependent dehydrogenase
MTNRLAPVEPVNVSDYERLAEQSLDPGAYGYFAGGAGDEVTLADNLAAFRRWQLRPRVLVDLSEASTETTVLGAPVSMPLLAGPAAFQRLAHPDGELATARAVAAAGTVMCLSTFATSSAAEVAAAAPEGRRWFQLYVYKDRGITRSLVDQAVDSGYDAIVVTVDAPFLGRRERDLRSGFAIPADLPVPSFEQATERGEPVTVFRMFDLIDEALTWQDLEELATLSDLPLLVKGILTDDDARLAVESGAAGVIVSNHGGRQLDAVPAALDALPEVAEAVESSAEVLVDGGVRRGTDVVKALALGARAVLVARPCVWGLAVDGEAGVRNVLELLRDEIRLALALTGCTSPEAVTRAHLQRAPR